MGNSYNMAGMPMWPIKEFPDQTICLSRRQAENLFRELRKVVGYIEAGIEHSMIGFVN